MENQTLKDQSDVLLLPLSAGWLSGSGTKTETQAWADRKELRPANGVDERKSIAI